MVNYYFNKIFSTKQHNKLVLLSLYLTFDYEHTTKFTFVLHFAINNF